MGDNKMPSKFLATLLKSVDMFGVEKTNAVLNHALNCEGEMNTEIVEFIFEIVCKEFKIQKKEIISGNSRSEGVRYNSSAIIAHLLRKHTSLKQKHVAELLNKTPAAISKYKSFLESLSENVKEHKEIMAKTLLIEQKVINRKKNPLITKSK